MAMKQKERSAHDVPGLNAILLILLISGSIGNRLCVRSRHSLLMCIHVSKSTKTKAQCSPGSTSVAR